MLEEIGAKKFEEISGLVKEMVDTGGKCCNP